MRIKQLKMSLNSDDESYITDNNPIIYMYITASDSWGNEEQGIGPSYSALAILTDINGVIKKRLNIVLDSEGYTKWDGSNKAILQMFLDKYNFLELDSEQEGE